MEPAFYRERQKVGIFYRIHGAKLSITFTDYLVYFFFRKHISEVQYFTLACRYFIDKTFDDVPV